MYRVHPCKREDGAVIITTAMALLLLLGFMGIALDFGRLFVAKSELQTAMDSCALAAAQELDGTGTAIQRARRAGGSAGNTNRVNFQSATWSGQGQITDAEVTFKNAAYVVTTDPTIARYAQCQHSQAGIQSWLLRSLVTVTGDAATYPATRNVVASAVATRGSAQTTCPLPLAMKPKAGGTAPDYGFAIGEWVTLLHAQNAAAGGQIGWANLDGSNSASETEAELNGHCGVKVGDTLGTPGVQSSIADSWNSRFGIYKNSGSPSAANPDFTGYGYTATSWPSQQNAYSGTPTAQNFVSQRAAFGSCAPSGRVKGANSCESITGLSLNGGFQTLATAGTAGEHQQYGVNRRLVLVPVINASSKLIDYVCMLMLHPMPIPMANVKLEYRGNASLPSSPCVTNGTPGGTAGPLVPVLVR